MCSLNVLIDINLLIVFLKKSFLVVYFFKFKIVFFFNVLYLRLRILSVNGGRGVFKYW